MSLRDYLAHAIRYATGRSYPALERELDRLSEEARRDLLRFVHELGEEAMRARTRSRKGPF